MSKLLDFFGVWYILRMLFYESVIKPRVIKPLTRRYIKPFIDVVVEDVSTWPKVAHRLEGHVAKWSIHCVECRLNNPTQDIVDSIH